MQLIWTDAVPPVNVPIVFPTAALEAEYSQCHVGVHVKNWA